MGELRALAALAAIATVAAAHGKGPAATPITACGQTVTTNAVLTKSLSCTGPGIVVGAGGITIDLKGFTIRGDRASDLVSDDTGVDDAGGYGNVTIEGGSIRDFHFGVYASGHHVLVSHVTVFGCDTGISLQGKGSSVTSSTAVKNTNYGIALHAADASVVSSTAIANGIGILAVGPSVSVRKSTLSGNVLLGLEVHGDAASVDSSIVSWNGADRTGAAVNDGAITVVGDAASIRSSLVIGNGTNGIYVDGNAALLSKNRVAENGYPHGYPTHKALGIVVAGFTTPPTGRNAAHGNDDPAECSPASLC